MPSTNPSRRPRRTARAIEPVTVPVHARGRNVDAVASLSDSVYHIYMSALAMLAILVSIGLLISPTQPDVVGVLTAIDFVICMVFFYDFLRNLWMAPSKKQYLLGWGIIDLLSCIPFMAEVRWLRLTRLFRLVMILRAVRILMVSARTEPRSIIMAAATLSIQLVFILLCIIVLHVEYDAPGSNIRSAGDVLWWAMATVATVGYGDRYPVTMAGRICGAILMVSGIGYLATILGVFAQTFVPTRNR